MPTFYNDVDSKLESIIKNLLTSQAATSGSNISTVDIHTGLSTADIELDLIFGLVESAEETPSGTGNWVCQTTIAVYTSAHDTGLTTHRARVAEVRDLFMSDCLATTISDNSTENLTCLAVQNYQVAQRIEDNYFIGEISFDAICYGQ
jgi:hypothetical protein